MILCDELEIALESEALFYGAPLRRQGEPAHTRRLFKLNGLWFEGELDTVRRNRTNANGEPTFDEVKKIKAIHLVDQANVPISPRMPRPALVLPGRIRGGNFTLEDSLVGHRHLEIGNTSGDRRPFVWDIRQLDEGKPWVRPGETASWSIQEYTAAVDQARKAIHDRYDNRVAGLRAIKAEKAEAARAAQDAIDAAADPIWGSW